jgi:predicted KAP-like P-loop ATPase
MSTYHTDQPLESSDDDLFGRAQYAENIAKVILTQPINEKYIIGLYSPWGYGKSSMLNMMQSHLEQEDTLVILFNPWIYTDLHSMTAGLLSEVAKKINDVELGYDRDQPTGLKEKSKRWTKRSLKMIKTRGVKNTIADSIGSVAEATSYSTQGVSIGKSVANAARMVGKESFNTLKKNVEQNIKDLNKRVVVIVDDVDRLDKDEIFQLFKLVKAVADFKGITYVIAFDDVAVAQALNSRFSSDNSAKAGRDFLEKIIQIPLSLPHIPREELRDMFIKDINSLLTEYKLEVSDDDQSRFWTIFDKHILPHLKTPRMIKRYLNLLTFTLPLAGNEMNVSFWQV